MISAAKHKLQQQSAADDPQTDSPLVRTHQPSQADHHKQAEEAYETIHGEARFVPRKRVKHPVARVAQTGHDELSAHSVPDRWHRRRSGFPEILRCTVAMPSREAMTDSQFRLWHAPVAQRRQRGRRRSAGGQHRIQDERHVDGAD